MFLLIPPLLQRVILLSWMIILFPPELQAITENHKLMPAGEVNGDRFGRSVSASGDTVITGAIYNDDAAYNAGAAYVFTRSTDGAWKQEAKLTASDSVKNHRFGCSVALSGDIAIIGAYGDDAGGAMAGAAYVFVRSVDGTWTQETKLMASDAAEDDRFGISVSISGDTAIIGADYNKSAESDSGAAYVFDVEVTPEEETFDLLMLIPALIGKRQSKIQSRM